MNEYKREWTHIPTHRALLGSTSMLGHKIKYLTYEVHFLNFVISCVTLQTGRADDTHLSSSAAESFKYLLLENGERARDVSKLCYQLWQDVFTSEIVKLSITTPLSCDLRVKFSDKRYTRLNTHWTWKTRRIPDRPIPI